MAARARVNASTLSRWESGKYSPSVPELEAVLRALGATEAQHREMLGQINAPRALQALQGQEGIGVPVGGDLLRAMRLRRGFTQAEVARSMGVKQGQVAKWEHSDAWPDANPLHALCHTLGAQPDEVTALTTGRFRWDAGRSLLSASRRTDSEEWLSQIDGLLFQNPYDLLDLTFLSVEVRLWEIREQQSFAFPLLAVAYAHHARSHLFHHKPAQAAFWARRTLELAKQPATVADPRHAGWGAAVVASAAALASTQRRGDLRRAVALLEEWLPAVHNPAFRAWILSDLASYHARLNNADAAIAISRGAIKEARSVGDGEFLYRFRDHAQLLADLGRYKEALETLEESRVLITLNGDAFVRHHLLEAECFIGVGSVTEASEAFFRAEARLHADQISYLTPQRDALRDRIV